MGDSQMKILKEIFGNPSPIEYAILTGAGIMLLIALLGGCHVHIAIDSRQITDTNSVGIVTNVPTATVNP